MGGVFTQRFGPSDQIKTSSATVWNGCMPSLAVWGLSVDSSRLEVHYTQGSIVRLTDEKSMGLSQVQSSWVSVGDEEAVVSQVARSASRQRPVDQGGNLETTVREAKVVQERRHNLIQCNEPRQLNLLWICHLLQHSAWKRSGLIPHSSQAPRLQSLSATRPLPQKWDRTCTALWYSSSDSFRSSSSARLCDWRSWASARTSFLCCCIL